MCGICGFTGASDNIDDWKTIHAMCNAMAHRGPDGEGFYLANGIALGHRRLALVDQASGGQPMIRATSELRSPISTPAVSFDHTRGDEAALSSASYEDRPTMTRGQWAIVFNGEIYNYRDLRTELENLGYAFETNSDTEVLLVGFIAWNEKVLQRVRGMFAFAIYDASSGDLFCARDFFGIKPFYYTVCAARAEESTSAQDEKAHRENRSFIFASEIKSILEHPAYERELNEDALAQYLCFQFSTLHETFFKGVYKLPPGHYMRVHSDASCEFVRYWKPEFAINDELDEHEAVEAIDAVMRDSVRYHNVADVEVGSFLSSGIDSSYLAALLCKENPSIKTFTVGFSEYEGERDEVSWAHELAGLLNVENDSHHITEEEYWKVLPLVQWHMDEPSADPSAVALYFVDKLAAQRVKAVLSGEGADEFFAGYRIYQTPLANEHVGMLPKFILRAGSKALRTAGLRGANYLERASEQVEDWYYTNANGVAFTCDERDEVLNGEVLARLASIEHEGGAQRAVGLVANEGDTLSDSTSESPGLMTPQQLVAPLYEEVHGLDETTRMQYVDLWFWLVGDILLKTDKMAMAHSLESRVPFLDRNVFQVAATIPARLRVNEEQTKIPLRKAAERAIPEAWAQKEKLGFPVPVVAWLREEPYYELVKQAFSSDEARLFFKEDALMRLLDDHRMGIDNSRRIWIVYSFLLWYRVYFIEQKKPTAQAGK